MDFQSTFIEESEGQTTLKKAGIILKGSSRNTRQPVHILLLCDTSGSMESSGKLDSVKKSLNLLLTLLSPDDSISLVTFSDDAKTILANVVPSAENREAIQYRVQSLRASGSTNLSAGLVEAKKILRSSDSTRKQGIIILTDGYANLGVTSQEGLEHIVTNIQSQANGITVTTVAYGAEHNADLLTQISKTGGGAYNVVNTLEDVATVFGDILGGLVSVSVQALQIQLPPEAELISSYRNSKNETANTVYIGDIYADSEITLLFTMNPSNRKIHLQATNMLTLEPIDSIVEVEHFNASVPIPKSIRIAECRQETANLLRQVAEKNDRRLLPLVEKLMEKIQTDPIIQDHPLRGMLLEDLVEAKKAIQSGGQTNDQTVLMMQHSGFLETTRGLRSIGTPVRGEPRQTNFLSPFATETQSRFAAVMATMSQQGEDPAEMM